MEERLLSQLKERGYDGRIVSAEHLPELQEGIEGPRRRGLLDEDLYQTCLAGFEFNPPNNLPEARSLLVVAVPHPQTQFTFTWHGERVRVPMPVAYLHDEESVQQVEDLLANVLATAGYHVTRATLPKKLLSVRSGLGRYGRNNLTYCTDMGSLLRLDAFHSDLPCLHDDWAEPQLLDRCETCKACLRGCPTEAISTDRFLAQAERCLTFHNEKPGDVPFPSWISASAHNCLVGCLCCQRVCPENHQAMDWTRDGEEFSEDETAEILESVSPEQLSRSVLEKLHRADLMSHLEVLPRNLKALLRPMEEG
jgi:epoxyqueuosine reductase